LHVPLIKIGHFIIMVKTAFNYEMVDLTKNISNLLKKTQKHFEASIPGAVFTTPHFLRNL